MQFFLGLRPNLRAPDSLVDTVCNEYTFCVRCVRNIACYTVDDDGSAWSELLASQRSLQNESIFRLLLKVAVIRVHQCESILIFCGVLTPMFDSCANDWRCSEVELHFSLRAERHSAVSMQNESVCHTIMHQVTYLAGVGRGSCSSFS